MTLTQKLCVAVLVVIAVMIFLTSLISGINKNEYAECLTLQNYSERYSEFFLTEWQSEMCAHAEVEINAPVRKDS